ncbi:MAG: hypothetical protein OXF88_15565, partial [Rhodobacteraceae bacterium]|nr:hypothetical protein [Paracoccaceae bacterium]
AGLNMQQSFGDTSVALSLGHYQVSQVGAMTDLKSGINDDRITVGRYMSNNAAIKAYADAIAGTSDNDADDDGTAEDVNALEALRTAAKAANDSNMGAFDKSMAKADDHTFSNFGLQVGFGSFSFNAAYARNEGGGYMVKKMPIMVNANTQTGRDSLIEISETASNTDDGTAQTLTADLTAQTHHYNKGTADDPDWVAESVTNNDPMNDIAQTVLVKDKSQDYDLMSVGARYSDGPMAVSLTHMMGEDDAGMESEATMLSVRYTLAPGVSSKSSFISGEQGTVEGTAFVTGIAISF